jgi:hypothetical protein
VKKSREEKNLRRITTDVFDLLPTVNTSIYSISASLPPLFNLPNIAGVLLPNIMSVPNIVGVLGLIWVFKHHNLFAKSNNLSRLAVK